MRNRRKNISGFTLIELLTVIMIIIIMAGLMFSAIMKVYRTARQKDRECEVNTITSAIKNYRYEYDNWPCPNDGTYSNNNYKIFQDYMLEGSPNNQKGIKFINIGDYKLDSKKNITDWKNVPYTIVISFTNDSLSVY